MNRWKIGEKKREKHGRQKLVRWNPKHQKWILSESKQMKKNLLRKSDSEELLQKIKKKRAKLEINIGKDKKKKKGSVYAEIWENGERKRINGAVGLIVKEWALFHW